MVIPFIQNYSSTFILFIFCQFVFIQRNLGKIIDSNTFFVIYWIESTKEYKNIYLFFTLFSRLKFYIYLYIFFKQKGLSLNKLIALFLFSSNGNSKRARIKEFTFLIFYICYFMFLLL